MDMQRALNREYTREQIGPAVHMFAVRVIREPQMKLPTNQNAEKYRYPGIDKYSYILEQSHDACVIANFLSNEQAVYTCEQ